MSGKLISRMLIIIFYSFNIHPENMNTAKLIEQKIAEGKALLLAVEAMRKTTGMAINVVYYVGEDVEDCKKQINKWQLTSKEILISAFGESHRYVSSFERTRTNKDFGYNYKREFTSEVNEGLSVLESISETLKLGLDNDTPKATKQTSNKVFIVHGHTEAVNQEVARTIEKLGLEVIILREQPNSGKTIIEKFEEYAKDVNFAVILLTADDKIEGEDTFRARQNVIFEMGYFMGALGRPNVMCMFQDNVEKPGDIDGVVYTMIDKAGVWKYSLVKELKACGYNVDANKVL